MNRLTLATAIAIIAATACTQTRPLPKHGTPPKPRPDLTIPPSSSAKTRPYVVFGERYVPITDATGYRERGVASWYGGKFHGRQTANGERYDMHQMTAAHTTLPLPTLVKVTNLRNGATVTVRVNDRGPFVKNRLIDLSYAAALQLGMVDDGTTLVEVEALSPGTTGGARATSTALPYAASRPVATESPGVVTATVADNPSSAPDITGSIDAENEPGLHSPAAARLFVQVGAFGEYENAHRMQSTLYNAGLAGVRLIDGAIEGIPVHRVQIGPIGSVEDYDVLMELLESIDVRDTHLVTE